MKINNLKKVMLATLAVSGGLIFGHTNNAQAASYKTVSIKSVNKTAYHKKSTSGSFFNISHTKVLHKLKNYPNTTFYVTKQATLQHGNTKAIYYYATNSKGVGGWIWHSYLVKGKAPFNLKYAKSFVAMDTQNGKILEQRSANTQRLVASTGKLMTIYLAVQKAEKENAWNKKVNVNSYSGLVNMGNNSAVGGFKFKNGHSYTVKQLYQAALIESSNNAAIALGQWVSGSNLAFINKMNQQAKAFNLSSKTKFVSASGLENDDLSLFGYWAKGGLYDGNMVSAKDLAVIATNLVNDYPQVINDSKLASKKVDGQTLRNVNNLLPGRSWYDKNLYVDGLKTGYTPRAGLCFVSTSKKPGKDRIVTVVLNDQNEFSETAELIRHIYTTNADFK